MNIVSLGNTVRPAIAGITSGKTNEISPGKSNSSRKVSASISFGKGKRAFVVRAKPRGPYSGAKGNMLNLGVYRQAGTRYIITLLEVLKYNAPVTKLSPSLSAEGSLDFAPRYLSSKLS